MLGLAREIDDLRLAAFALRDILEAIDRADNVSIDILDCLDVNERDTAQAVRSLDVYFLFAHGNTGTQHIGHGALMMREQTPQFGGAAVVSKNETIPVTNINGKWQLFEQPRGQFEDFFLITQTKCGAGCVRDYFDGSPDRFAPEGTLRVGRYAVRRAMT
jgi:hypothetical protein